MKGKHHFELSRFWLLVKLEFSRSRRGLVMTLLIILGILFILGLLLAPVMDPTMVVYEYASGYAFTLLTAGFILSSLAYRDLGNPLRRSTYLTLPASTLEKFLSMWLLTSAGWIVFYTCIYTLYSLLATALGQIIYPHLTFVPFQPLGSFALSIMAYYFVLQGIFLAGAAHFRGYPFPKTLLTLVIIGAIGGIIMYLIMKGYFDFDMGDERNPFAGMPSGRMWTVLKWLFWVGLAPVCWVLTYLGLKEQEV
jgi:hypothetical protein